MDNSEEKIRAAAKAAVEKMAFTLFGRAKRVLSPEEFPAGTPAYLTSLEITILEKDGDRWGTIIIDRTRPGTHATHNVLFNSACMGMWFPDEQTAVSESLAVAETRFLSDQAL